MIKATGYGPRDGKQTLFVGLTHGNLDRFRDAPMDSYILIKGEEVGVSHDVMIFSGRTEAEMTEMLSHAIGPETKVRIAGRSKN